MSDLGAGEMHFSGMIDGCPSAVSSARLIPISRWKTKTKEDEISERKMEGERRRERKEKISRWDRREKWGGGEKDGGAEETEIRETGGVDYDVDRECTHTKSCTCRQRERVGDLRCRPSKVK